MTINPKRLARGALRRLTTRSLRTDGAINLVMYEFVARCNEMTAPRVLELGTHRSHPEMSTRHDDWVPHASEFLGTDIEGGVDVDVVADVHTLSTALGREQFDIIISCSTFEHFKYPHLAAHEILKTLRVGGVLYVQTHQSYPLHAHPHDYFRFSTDALAGLFNSRMGFEALGAGYEFPARIDTIDATFGTDVFLNTCFAGTKLTPTPEQYLYELDDAPPM